MDFLLPTSRNREEKVSWKSGRVGEVLRNQWIENQKTLFLTGFDFREKVNVERMRRTQIRSASRIGNAIKTDGQRLV